MDKTDIVIIVMVVVEVVVVMVMVMDHNDANPRTHPTVTISGSNTPYRKE